MKSPAFKIIDPIILFGVLVLQVIIGWQKWADITQDYGRELYVPWRLACGDVLYKDIYVLYGPFSYYWNALLFKIFGPSINTLVVFNIVLVALMSAIIYRSFAYLSGHLTAFLTSLTFLVLFAFNQYSPHQGYNYICPYTYSLTYAMFLSVLTINIFISYCQYPRSIKHVALMGFLLGLISLTRLEIFFPIFIAVTAGVLFKAMSDGEGVVERIKIFASFILGILMPIAIAGIFFIQHISPQQLWQSNFAYNPRWKEVYSLYFYQFYSGLHDPKINFMVTARWALNYAAYITGLVCLGKGFDALFRKKKYIISSVLFLSGTGIIYWVYQTQLRPYQFDFLRGLPIFILIMTIYFFVQLFLHRFERQKLDKILPKVVMAVFSLLLIFRIILKVRIMGVGFVFALPGVLLAVMFLSEVIVQQVSKDQATKAFIKSIFFITWILVLSQSFSISCGYFKEKRSILGQGADQMAYAENKPGHLAEQVKSFLADIVQIVPKDEGFVVFPEGVMLNFMSKHKSPLPYVSYMPAEMVTYQEQNILRSFQKEFPSYIVINNVDNLKLYNYHELGKDYATKIMPWVLKNYQRVWPQNLDIMQKPSLSIYKRRFDQ